MAIENKTVCLDIEALYKALKGDVLSFDEMSFTDDEDETYCDQCNLSFGKIVFTNEGESGTYYDLYNDDGEVACMSGEEVYVVEVGEYLVTFRNDNGESSVYFTLTKQELEYAGLGRIWE